MINHNLYKANLPNNCRNTKPILWLYPLSWYKKNVNTIYLGNQEKTLIYSCQISHKGIHYQSMIQNYGTMFLHSIQFSYVFFHIYETLMLIQKK